MSAATSKEVAALIAAMKLLNRETAKFIRGEVRANSRTIVHEELVGHASTRLQVRGIVDTTRVTVSDQNITVQAGAVRGRFRNGLDPRKSIASLEFGSNGQRRTTYTRRSKHGSHRVTRRTMTQFGPRATRGNTFYPAVRELAPRIVSLYAQTFVRTVAELIEGKA